MLVYYHSTSFLGLLRKIGVLWAWLGHGLAMAWPWLGHGSRGLAMVWPWAWPWLGHDLAWLCHGSAMALPWLGLGSVMAQPWLRHGTKLKVVEIEELLGILPPSSTVSVRSKSLKVPLTSRGEDAPAAAGPPADAAGARCI